MSNTEDVAPDVDIDISLFNSKLNGSPCDLDKGMFDAVKSDTVNLWKYFLRVCCGLQLPSDSDHFDASHLYGDTEG